uniref:Uncharacterized protein n=1 Tax=Pectinophora gossypiella TaxID=13191 RepID=A0A1E1VXM7_PECGO
MPKPTKLHAKGKPKPKSMQKACNEKTSSSSSNDTDGNQENAMRQFELELCWCIQQLERTLNHKKTSETQVQDTWKVLQVLKNNNQPIIRKRQLMRTHFGDYRAKMLAEEKKQTKKLPL